MLLQIGEFARLTNLPVRTIRYYGDLGLLPPAEVDPSSGYRKYRIDQVERVAQLVALKDIGMSLEEIGLILDDRLDDRAFRDLLATKVDHLERENERISEQLQRARARLAQLTLKLEKPMAEVTIKTTEETTIAFVRAQIGGVEEIAPLFPKLFSAVDPADGRGPGGNIYHHFSDDGTSIDIEAVLPVSADYEAAAPAATRVIPPVKVASLMHHGAFNRLHEAHAALLGWVEDNGWQVAGPAYEWNLVCTPPVTQDDESYVTEVQVEVVEAS